MGCLINFLIDIGTLMHDRQWVDYYSWFFTSTLWCITISEYIIKLTFLSCHVCYWDSCSESLTKFMPLTWFKVDRSSCWNTYIKHWKLRNRWLKCLSCHVCYWNSYLKRVAQFMALMWFTIQIFTFFRKTYSVE